MHSGRGVPVQRRGGHQGTTVFPAPGKMRGKERVLSCVEKTGREGKRRTGCKRKSRNSLTEDTNTRVGTAARGQRRNRPLRTNRTNRARTGPAQFPTPTHPPRDAVKRFRRSRKKSRARSRRLRGVERLRGGVPVFLMPATDCGATDRISLSHSRVWALSFSGPPRLRHAEVS